MAVNSGTRWLPVGLIALVAVFVRLAYLVWLRGTPGFEWIDPDGYGPRARLLVTPDGGGWQWDLEAVRYVGPYVKAPLYPIFLALFVGSPFGDLWSAACVQAVLAGLSTLALWSLAHDLHSRRAGFLAAIAYGAYFPGIVSANTFMQERLYVPLLLGALAVLARACRNRRPALFVLAGMSLGFAALTRSMPVYFAGPVFLLLFFTGKDRWSGAVCGGAFLIGFATVVVPYSLFVSILSGQLVLVENIGAYGLARLTEGGRAAFAVDEAPGFVEVARFVWGSFAESPWAFVSEKLALMSGMFQLSAGRWLEVHGSFPTATAAIVGKIAAHLFGDSVFALSVLAAPMGLAVANGRPTAWLVGTWVSVHLVMTALSGYAGPRFREPIEGPLIALGSVWFAGGWARPGRTARIAGLMLALALAWPMARTLRATLRAWADYGIGPWRYEETGRSTVATGQAGFAAFPVRDAIDFRVSTVDEDGPVVVDVSVDGVPVSRLNVNSQGRRVVVAYRRNRAFVRLESPFDPAARMRVEVHDYPARRGR